MKLSWTAGLDKGQAEDMRGYFLSSHLLRKRLNELLQTKIDVAEQNSLAKNNYDLSNWAYLQADLVGYKRAINEIISLISDEK